MNKNRCFPLRQGYGGQVGNKPNQEYYADYHDNEWGVPVHDDRHLFEMLILEGAQAGLSWETILKRRDGYRKAFHNFDAKKSCLHDRCAVGSIASKSRYNSQSLKNLCL